MLGQPNRSFYFPQNAFGSTRPLHCFLMPPNVTVPLLIFDILVREFNAWSYTYVVVSSNYTAPNVIQQILGIRDVHVIENVDPLNSVSSPNCILLLSPSEWKQKSDTFEKGLIKCTILLAVALFEIPLVMVGLLNRPFRNVIAYSANESSDIRLVLPYHQPQEHRLDKLPTSVWGPSNYSALPNLLERNRMNLNGAEYIAAIFPKRFSAVPRSDGAFSGFDGEMLKLITTSINATSKIFYADRSIKYGYKLRNGSFVGILGDVYYWRADIACNSIFLKEYGSSDIVFSPAMLIEPLCIVVPAPLLVPNWKMVFRAFELEVWLCTAFAVVISMLLWYLLNLLAKTKPDFTGSVLFIGRIFISTVKLPKAMWQRIFTFSLILSACVLSTSFENSLLKLLKKRSYERKIKTMVEFKNSEYNIYTFSKNLVEDSTPQYLRGRVRLYRQVDEGVDLLEMVALHRNLSYLGRKCDIVQRIRDKNWQLHVLNDYPRVYFKSYIMRRGNLLVRPITTAISRILAAGFTQAPRLNNECNEPLKKKSRLIPKALALSNLMIAFYALKMGLLAALVAFLGEILTFYSTKYLTTWSRNRRMANLLASYKIW